jgi:hypothetical protein
MLRISVSTQSRRPLAGDEHGRSYLLHRAGRNREGDNSSFKEAASRPQAPSHSRCAQGLSLQPQLDGQAGFRGYGLTGSSGQTVEWDRQASRG